MYLEITKKNLKDAKTARQQGKFLSQTCPVAQAISQTTGRKTHVGSSIIVYDDVAFTNTVYETNKTVEKVMCLYDSKQYKKLQELLPVKTRLIKRR